MPFRPGGRLAQPNSVGERSDRLRLPSSSTRRARQTTRPAEVFYDADMVELPPPPTPQGENPTAELAPTSKASKVLGAVKKKVEKEKEEQRQLKLRLAAMDQQKAWADAQLVCPHCQQRGYVRTGPITLKKGISGGKATGAVLTGGLSLFATGLSHKEQHTQAHCSSCKSTWVF